MWGRERGPSGGVVVRWAEASPSTVPRAATEPGVVPPVADVSSQPAALPRWVPATPFMDTGVPLAATSGAWLESSLPLCVGVTGSGAVAATGGWWSMCGVSMTPHRSVAAKTGMLQSGAHYTPQQANRPHALAHDTMLHSLSSIPPGTRDLTSRTDYNTHAKATRVVPLPTRRRPEIYSTVDDLLNHSDTGVSLSHSPFLAHA